MHRSTICAAHGNSAHTYRYACPLYQATTHTCSMHAICTRYTTTMPSLPEIWLAYTSKTKLFADDCKIYQNLS